MKKAKQMQKPQPKMNPEQIVQFLEDFRQINHGKDEKTKLISIRIPANVLRSFKNLAEMEQRGYQSIIVQLMRNYIRDK